MLSSLYCRNPYALLLSLLWVLIFLPPTQNFVSSVFDAQFERHLKKPDGSSTLLGSLDEKLNLVPSRAAQQQREWVSRGWVGWGGGRGGVKGRVQRERVGKGRLQRVGESATGGTR